MVRGYGILFEDERAFAPFRLEVWAEGAWRPLDLPASGTSAPAVLRGDR